MISRDCGDCGAEPGEHHVPGCDVERCPRCGGQSISCDCIYVVNGIDPDTMETGHPAIFSAGPTPEMEARWEAEWGARRLPWTGVWPGQAECIEFGWFSKMTPSGWRPCSKDDPEAVPDLNRLHVEAAWDADAGRFVRRADAVPAGGRHAAEVPLLFRRLPCMGSRAWP